MIILTHNNGGTIKKWKTYIAMLQGEMMIQPRPYRIVAQHEAHAQKQAHGIADKKKMKVISVLEKRI